MRDTADEPTKAIPKKLAPFISRRHFPMKTKLDHYDLKAIVNGLYSMRNCYDITTRSLIDTLILRLIDIHDNADSHRKIEILFSDAERHIILKCLTDWRNLFLKEGKPGATEGVGDILQKIK